MTSNEITMTIDQLRQLLVAQKNATAEYITRNLSVYSFFNELSSKIDIDKAKTELKSQCYRSDFPDDFNVLSKYIKT